MLIKITELNRNLAGEGHFAARGPSRPEMTRTSKNHLVAKIFFPLQFLFNDHVRRLFLNRVSVIVIFLALKIDFTTSFEADG